MNQNEFEFQISEALLEKRKKELLSGKKIPKNQFLNQSKIGMILQKLLEEREKILQTENDKNRYCLDKNELADPLDEAAINIQASNELRMRNRTVFYLKKINKSLDRILSGNYGECEECEGEINFERLLARPTAELCINCKEEAELNEKNNIFGKKSKSLGKDLRDIGKP
ncbi:MAG: TraR/DksA family transcriptional regulator [Bacteriovoracales bacterium]